VFGRLLPAVHGPLPGPASRSLLDRLALHECPAITARRTRRAAHLGAEHDDPIVWRRSAGANVEDADGNVLVDMTAGFGVMSVGHANPAVVAAGQERLAVLPHAMGDAFPDASRVALLEALAARTGLAAGILGCSGSDAIEAALKTARLATGRDGVVAFTGGYHGLSHGALGVTAYRSDAFRAPFAGQLSPHVRFAPFGGSLGPLDGVGAIVVEVIQGRGGLRAAPSGWLREVQRTARAAGALLIVDEIFTGFGRTGDWFAYTAEGIEPDLLCVGKSLGGGFPISACFGTRAAMDAWGASSGEAIHTQTFLGNPVGCSMALATLGEVERLLPAVAPLSSLLRTAIEGLGLRVRGRGLALGIELGDALRTSRALLQRGWIALPAGERGEVLSLTPPFVLTEEQAEGFVQALAAVA
jgi:4-aminobutyrate aminotransferase-like enzyme